METLLHVTDFSSNSDEAFLLACSIARDRKAKLIVLHVVNSGECAPHDISGESLAPESDLLEKINSQFEYMRSLTYDVLLTFKVILGDTVQTVLDVATNEHCDMIVLAGRNQTSDHYEAHGCISEALIRHAHCSVLVLRRFHASSATEPHHNAPAQNSVSPVSLVVERCW